MLPRLKTTRVLLLPESLLLPPSPLTRPSQVTDLLPMALIIIQKLVTLQSMYPDKTSFLNSTSYFQLPARHLNFQMCDDKVLNGLSAACISALRCALDSASQVRVPITYSTFCTFHPNLFLPTPPHPPHSLSRSLPTTHAGKNWQPAIELAATRSLPYSRTQSATNSCRFPSGALLPGSLGSPHRARSPPLPPPVF